MTARQAAHPPQSWSLRLLDGWQLDSPHGEAAVATRERRVVALLALKGERSRSHVASTLWPDSGDAHGHGNLRAAVWRIKHNLPDLIEEHNGKVRLAPGVAVDAHEVRSAAQRIHTIHHLPPSGELLELLAHEALLPGWHEDWVEEERGVLHQVRLRALEDVAQRLLDAGDLDAALLAAMRAAAIDPLRESAQRVLIRVHLREGNHIEAIRVYHEFRKRLTKELGIAVSAQIVSLMRPLHVRALRATRTSARVESAPLQTVPVQTVPIEAVPIQAVPIQAVPVETLGTLSGPGASRGG